MCKRAKERPEDCRWPTVNTYRAGLGLVRSTFTAKKIKWLERRPRRVVFLREEF